MKNNKIKYHILITDDDDKIRSLLKDFLLEKKFIVSTAENADEAIEMIKLVTFDLLIIDIMMPGINGFELTKKIRTSSNVPIIHLTAMNEKKDVIEGLETGADDYIAKPFEPKELELRINNILKKNSPKATREILQLNNLILDLNSGSIRGSDKDMILSDNEIKILQILSSKPGKAFQRDYLIQSLGFNQERTLDVCVNRLRKKIEKNPKIPKYLKTKRGSGYLLWID
jgi:two-component system, OmpR family, phosphate regulon response regulator OmpR|tara:strand:+ start:187 stop:870 length:684 start_codon:yes stop_codon:yes gene_type:complete